MILPDWKIRQFVQQKGMISPFIDYPEADLLKKNKNGKIDSGLSSAGYDFKLDYNFKHVSNDVNIVDPKQPGQFLDVLHESRFLLRPGVMVLGQTVETFDMPEDVLGLVFTRSTLARVGNFLNVTPIEPDWRGQITLEISNIGSDPVWIYPGEGIGQIIFMQIDGRPERTYADKQGKYQNQHGVTGPIVQMGVG